VNKRKNILVRLPESVHAWLKQNVTDGTITDWIVDAIQRKISESKPITIEDIDTKTPRRFLDLLLIRNKWVDNQAYANDFEALEGYLLKGVMQGGYNVEGLKAHKLSSVPESVKELMWQEYFMRLHELDDEQRHDFYDIIRDANLRRLCGKDSPDKVIYGEFTAAKLIKRFDKNATYTIMSVAAELGISYKDAYTHIVPWLIGHGFSIKVK